MHTDDTETARVGLSSTLRLSAILNSVTEQANPTQAVAAASLVVRIDQPDAGITDAPNRGELRNRVDSASRGSYCQPGVVCISVFVFSAVCRLLAVPKGPPIPGKGRP